MTRNRDGEPAYKKIKNAIRQRIESGRLQPGDPIPSERDLAKIHHVSLMTARHAVIELTRDGVVERRRGAGTFVAPPQVHFNKLLAYTEQMASVGLAAHSRTISRAVVSGEHEVAARLGVPSGSRLARLERVRLAGSEPVALEICYWPADEFRPLLDAPLDHSSLFASLESKCGVQLAYADEEIDVTTADSNMADLLSIPRGAPLLRIRQVIFSTTGKATLYVTGFYRSGRHTLRIRRFR
jgi:GntR family transcriptional regulator